MSNKPIIAVFAQVRHQHLDEIQKLAPAFQVVDARQSWPEEQPADKIEIAFGWQASVCQKALTAGNLKWLQTISAGVNSYPLAALSKHQVSVTNASGIHAIPISESVLGMLLSYERGLLTAASAQAQRHWQRDVPYGELYGKTLLICGTGKVGSRLAAVSSALGLSVHGVNRSGHEVPGFAKVFPQTKLKTALQTADIVVNILPETPETQHLFNAEIFCAMQAGTTFINVGRGGTVDTDALINALQSGQLAFAGLDVFEQEPLPETSPLWTMENVFITPHISGRAANFKNRLYTIFETNLKHYLTTGQPVENIVNLKNGY